MVEEVHLVLVVVLVAVPVVLETVVAPMVVVPPVFHLQNLDSGCWLAHPQALPLLLMSKAPLPVWEGLDYGSDTRSTVLPCGLNGAVV